MKQDFYILFYDEKECYVWRTTGIIPLRHNIFQDVRSRKSTENICTSRMSSTNISSCFSQIDYLEILNFFAPFLIFSNKQLPLHPIFLPTHQPFLSHSHFPIKKLSQSICLPTHLLHAQPPYWFPARGHAQCASRRRLASGNDVYVSPESCVPTPRWRTSSWTSSRRRRAPSWRAWSRARRRRTVTRRHPVVVPLRNLAWRCRFAVQPEQSAEESIARAEDGVLPAAEAGVGEQEEQAGVTGPDGF